MTAIWCDSKSLQQFQRIRTSPMPFEMVKFNLIIPLLSWFPKYISSHAVAQTCGIEHIPWQLGYEPSCEIQKPHIDGSSTYDIWDIIYWYTD